MCSIMIVCVLLPRFELAVAAGGRAALAQGPMALAPEPGREQVVGEVSQAAEALGIHPGMRLGEALARAPRLALTPPDPVGVADAWERVLARLEAVGAAVESERPGVGVLRGARAAAPARRLARRHRGRGARRAAAARADRRRPLALLRGRRGGPRAHPPRAHRARRRGPRGRAGRPAAPPRADRAPAGRARAPGDRDPRRARGAPARRGRRPLRPGGHPRPRPRARARHPAAPAHAARGAGGDARPGGVGVRRAARARARACSSTACSRGPTAAGACCAPPCSPPALVEGGTWRERVVFREPTADPLRMRLVLAQRLQLLPAPAESLRLTAEQLGAAAVGRARALRGGRRARAPTACARRSARRARPPAPTPRCACSRSTPTRACPSAARC